MSKSSLQHTIETQRRYLADLEFSSRRGYDKTT